MSTTLFFDPHTGKIKDDDGRDVPETKAARLAKAGKVADCNWAFQRWEQNGYNTAATLQWYKDN